MKTGLIVFACMFLWLATPAFGHRLDEYLQATTIGLEKDHVEVQLRLTPGAETFRTVLAEIDTNGDGTLSDGERRAYAERVRHDLALRLDGRPRELRLVSLSFPKIEEMKEGLGDIVLNFEADVSGEGPHHRLTLENHHEQAIAAYLVNCLVPSDPNIQITAQDRNYDQSFYQLDYAQGAAASAPSPEATASAARGWRDPTGSGSLFRAFFYRGILHILTGYDHLLFVTALVLAATTLWDLVKVVSAFTIAHTMTLTLAALDLVHLPGRVVEPLIAGSILFVALQNVFWPRQSRGWSRLGAAFFFGLFHGLGFAGGLLEAMREMPSGTMLLAICAFSVGVEAGHQLVVLPSFGLLKAARHGQADVVTRARLSMAFQRIGSAGICVAGAYYLCLALAGQS
ncbi:MAG TPA: HupE/UreJ family protein [Phycisphaerae bacterium]|nr:HupE/UreJ family protein [Phycisphaerae bacterium]